MPPEEASLPDGTRLALRSLAEEICGRYRLEFPDEEERYGEAGIAWCVHDTQYLLSWAALDLTLEPGLLARHVDWLAGILRARSFPLERLARDLELAAETVSERHPEAEKLSERLREVAGSPPF